MTEKDNLLFTLSDGRKLGYLDLGDHTSPTIVYFHGLPSSRLEAKWISNLGIDVRIIAIDRPGAGLSSIQNDRKLLDWPKDVTELLNHLDIEKFYLVACSGGAAYACVCAKMIPSSRIEGVCIISGMGPRSLGLEGMAFGQKINFWATENLPFIVRPFINMTYVPLAKREDLEEICRKTLESNSESDRRISENREYIKV